MASWITPKTNWTSSDYYNYSDLNRVENNVEVIKDLLTTIGYLSSIGSIETGRTINTIEFATSLNRIETNISELRDAFYQPPTWTEPKITWADLDSFDYNDANRLELNLLNLYNLINNAILSFKFCGSSQAVCGIGQIL